MIFISQSSLLNSQIHNIFKTLHLHGKKNIIQDYRYIFIYTLLLILYGILNPFWIYILKYVQYYTTIEVCVQARFNW